MEQTDTALLEALRELANEEGALAVADNNLGLAMSRYRVAARRYAAVRDVLEEMLHGTSPYSTNITIPVPSAPEGDCPWDSSPNFGRYRYLFKAVGEAVSEVLQDEDGPLTLSELVIALKEGGLTTDLRSVNASLLNMKGVIKLDNGRYQDSTGMPTDEIDDLPF